jgi:hypothetical protein
MMSMFAAWVVYPLVLLALCTGLGLLVDAICGRRLPGALIPPVGLAAIVVLGQFMALDDATAELTVPFVCFLAVLGGGFALPWRFARPRIWAIGAPFAAFAVYAAPVVLSGHPTFAGYIDLDDTASWFALTDRVMSHGRDLAGLEPSTYRATLEGGLANGRPVGVFLPFGTTQKLLGGDLAWVFQPYLSFLAAMLALCLWQVVGGILSRPWVRALATFVAAQPALLFGYALWGGIKELGAALFIALAAAVAPGVVEPDSPRRAVAVPALAAGGLVGVLNVGGLIWIAPMSAALACLAVRTLGSREAGARAIVFVFALLVFALPVLTVGGFSPFQSGVSGESVGNLVSSLNPLQALGIWPSGDFRVAPSTSVASAILIALGVLAALFGLWATWRRRGIGMLLLATSIAAAGAIVLVGSPRVDGMALAMAAPAALALAICGAIAAARLQRIIGVLLATIVAGGVLWSNVLAYGGADLAPYAQLAELQQIGEDFAGQGPALMTEYNPYGARHFLRYLEGEGASGLRVREVPLLGGGMAARGNTVDTDQLDRAGLYEFRTLVLRRSPVRSRPPLIYHPVWTGAYYEVWQRLTAPTLFPSGTLPLSDGIEPAALPDCDAVVRFGRAASHMAAGEARLVAARHAPIYEAAEGTLRIPRSGGYEGWLEGSVRGSVELLVDGHRMAEARQQLENDGGFVQLGRARLSAGSHDVELRFGGADLHPGSGGFPRPETGPLLFAPAGAGAGKLVWVPTERSRSICGKRWDWIESLGAN